MTDWTRVEHFLHTDPQDVGCDEAMAVLEIYAELMHADPAAARRRYPGVAVHLSQCGPCAEDLAGVLRAIVADEADAAT